MRPRKSFQVEIYQFIIDEAHSTGVIGPNGLGLVDALGLEKEVAIRMHTFGKALSAAGGKTFQTIPYNPVARLIFP